MKCNEILSLNAYIVNFSLIDQLGNPDEILAFLAIKTDSRPDAAEIKKDIERKKGW